MPRREAGEALASAINVSGWLPLSDIQGPVPEGGTRAWFVATGLTCCLFTSYGYINSWGVFQTYYEQNLHIGLTPTTISWIGAAQRTLFFLFSVLASGLFNMGYFKRSTFIPASLLFVLSVFLTGECERFWQFLVCQGVLGGMASGCLVANIAAICAQWFKKRYDLVLGIAYAGSAVGGVVYPVLAGVLLPRVEFKWSMRIFSLVSGVGVLIACSTIQRRLPPAEKRETPLMSRLKPLKSPAFSMYCLALVFQIIGFYTFMTYVSSTAVTKGSISLQFGYYLVGILNASTGLGRVGANAVVRRFGAFNIIIPTLAISGVILVGGWPVVDDTAGMVVLTVAYALCAAPHNALASRTIAVFSTSDSGDISLRIGLFNLFAAVAGLVGPPLGGEVGMEGGMKAMGGYAGGSVIIASALLFGCRYLLLGRKFRGKI